MKMTRTPLRISFFGGGTDYPEHFNQHGGAVLASAIDKFSYITASRFPCRLFDYNIRVSYRKVELVKQVAEIEHNVYRACLEFCGLEQGVELHNVADLPSFTGLGSSSTFTVGLLHALHAFKQEVRTPLELAYEAIHVERDILKENVGCQDQTLAAMGGLNLVEFFGTDDIRVSPLNLHPTRVAELESHLLVVFTGVTRRASDVAASQLARVDQNRDTLTSMRLMVDEATEILAGTGPLEAFGELLNMAWQAKRSLCERISNSKIDEMYDQAMQHGALGGKLLGAGGGGFLLLFAAPDRHQKLTDLFSDYEIISVKLNAAGSEVVFDPS